MWHHDPDSGAPATAQLRIPRPSLLYRIRARHSAVAGAWPAPLGAIGAGVGLIFGLLEGSIRALWPWLGSRFGSPDLWVNWNAPWLAPLSLAAWLGVLGCLLSLLAFLLPRTVRFLAPNLLTALAAWSTLGPFAGLHSVAAGLLVAGVTFRFGRLIPRESSVLRARLRQLLPAAVGLWALLFVCTGLRPWLAEPWALATGPAPPKSAPNVLLVVLDTVRADHLGLHGYARPTSPHIDALARTGIAFANARATAPFTLGTHASLFTGHPMMRTSARAEAPLDSQLPTLAETLRDRGYATAGFVGNIFYGSAHYGLDRGFLHYHDIPGNITRKVTPREFVRACHLGSVATTWFERKRRILRPMQLQRLDAQELNRELLSWVDSTRSHNRPYFLFLNLFDAHLPYSLPSQAPQPFARVMPEELDPLHDRVRSLEDQLWERGNTRVEPELAQARARFYPALRNAYDDGIAWIDQQLHQLMRSLDERELLDNTIVVITSDHGEMLGEHALVGHGQTLRRPVIHVPLVVVAPPRMNLPAGLMIDQPVTLADVPATILDLAGIEQPSPALGGRSLRRHWSHDGIGPPDPEAVVSEAEHMPWQPRSPRMPMADGPIWLVTKRTWSYHRQEHERLGRVEELYDLSQDPQETTNLITQDEHQETLADLRAELDRWLETQPGS